MTLGVIVATIALTYRLLGPGGMVQQKFTTWRHDRATRQFVSAHWQEIVTGGARLDSNSTAPLLTEFADFQCPYCRAMHDSLSAFMIKHPDVGIAYRHFPLLIHPQAGAAAKAAVCAQEQEHFIGFYHHLYGTTAWESHPNWGLEALKAGVPDSLGFVRCMSNPSIIDRVSNDVSLARALRLQGTPAFVTVHGVKTGVLTYEELRDLVYGSRD